MSRFKLCAATRTTASAASGAGPEGFSASTGRTGEVAGAGRLALNGSGSITGTETVSLYGSIHTASVTGTYKINSNCTGTAILNPAGLSPMHLSLAVVNGGKQMMAIETDANTIVTGTFQE